MSEITDVAAREVLDSRGHPTVRAAVSTADATGSFTVPSGASTGQFEAVERRDGEDRYDGMGVRGAVAAVEDDLAGVVTGRDVTDQSGIDAALERADGTETFANFGANAVLAVSGAVLHAASEVSDLPLHRHLSEGYSRGPSMPTPMVNVISGGSHAEGGMEIQDFLVIPRQVETYETALETVWDVRNAVRTLVADAGHRPLLADEGGFSPPMDAVSDAFELLVDGIADAGYAPGEEVAIGVDVAATQFYDSTTGTYRLRSVERELTSEEMISLVLEWSRSYPLLSVEDPLAEDDWGAWSRLAERLDDGIQLLGDDLLVTDRGRLRRAVNREAVSAVLVKPNQAGTISRALGVISAATETGVAPVVSARSGETCDTTIADLAVGFGAGQIKIGSLARSERLAKYNRLLEIERTTPYSLARPFAG